MPFSFSISSRESCSSETPRTSPSIAYTPPRSPPPPARGARPRRWGFFRVHHRDARRTPRRTAYARPSRDRRVPRDARASVHRRRRTKSLSFSRRRRRSTESSDRLPTTRPRRARASRGRRRAGRPARPPWSRRTCRACPPVCRGSTRTRRPPRPRRTPRRRFSRREEAWRASRAAPTILSRKPSSLRRRRADRSRPSRRDAAAGARRRGSESRSRPVPWARPRRRPPRGRC